MWKKSGLRTAMPRFSAPSYEDGIVATTELSISRFGCFTVIKGQREIAMLSFSQNLCSFHIHNKRIKKLLLWPFQRKQEKPPSLKRETSPSSSWPLPVHYTGQALTSRVGLQKLPIFSQAQTMLQGHSLWRSIITLWTVCRNCPPLPGWRNTTAHLDWVGRASLPIVIGLEEHHY